MYDAHICHASAKQRRNIHDFMIYGIPHMVSLEAAVGATHKDTIRMYERLRVIVSINALRNRSEVFHAIRVAADDESSIVIERCHSNAYVCSKVAHVCGFVYGCAMCCDSSRN